MKKWIFLVSLIILIAAQALNPAIAAGQSSAAYPETAIIGITDTLHGTPVYDPYRWLEDGSDSSVIEWTRAQNAYTREILDAIPGRDRLQARIEKALKKRWMSTPKVEGSRLFLMRQSEIQNQPVLYMRDGIEGIEIALVDPNKLSKHGIASLDWYFPSHDGKLLAYGVSWSGDENSTLYILDTDNLTHLDDTIPRTGAASVMWLPDNSSFYYTRYPAKGEVPDGEEVYHRRIFYHKLGDNPRSDREVFGGTLDMQDWTDVHLSESGRYLVAYVFKGWSKTDLYLDDLSTDEGFVPLAKGENAYFDGLFLGEDFYVRTNHNAPNYRILKADFGGKDVSEWNVIVPEDHKRTLQSFSIAADRIALTYLEDVSSRLMIMDPATGDISEVHLPGIGNVGSVRGDIHGSDVFFAYTSFMSPRTIFRYDVVTNILDRFDGVEADVDPSLFTTELAHYDSKDGTRISMFIVHRKDLTLDGDNPTMLTGYGGFNHSQTPYFSSTRMMWLNAGGVFALPHLRGGGEYGEKWHQDGMLSNKQHTFDDFMAAAEYLIDHGYTNSDRLAIWGGSNGGLLVGAAMTQRPDLFRVVICGNPLLDMIRYHMFLIAKLWIPEYGSSDDPQGFEWLYGYSPYHHVIDGVNYPATMILTSDSDSRVDPLHARKMIARLQAANASSHPQLLRFEFEAGHGAGTPTWKRAERYTDIYSFIAEQLHMQLVEQ